MFIYIFCNKIFQFIIIFSFLNKYHFNNSLLSHKNIFHKSVVKEIKTLSLYKQWQTGYYRDM